MEALMDLFGIKSRREQRQRKLIEATVSEVAQKSLSTKYPELARIFPNVFGGDTYRETLRDPYKQLPNIYAFVNATARRVARTPLRFYRPGTDTEVESHPAIDRFNNPAPFLSRMLLLEAVVVNKEISGEFLILKDAELTRGVPDNLWVYPRSKYDPKFRNGGFVAWEIRPENAREPVIATVDEVIYDRYYHPNDEIRGLAPLTAARISAETEYEARRYNRTFFENDANPGRTYTTEQSLTQQQYDRLTHDLFDTRRGVERSNRGILLDNGLKPVTDGFSQKDIQFIEQFNLTLHDIGAVYGVDPAIIGHEELSKYASVKEARRYFWTDKVIPFAHSIADKLNQNFFLAYNIELRFDFSNVEALNDVVLEKADAAHKYAQLGYTRNEINERLGLGFPAGPEHDAPAPFAIPAASMQLGATAPERKSETGEQPSHDDEGIKALRAARWKEVDQKIRPAIGKMRKRLRSYFHQVEQNLLRQLVKDGRIQIQKQGDIDPDQAFDEDKLRAIFLEFIGAGAKIGYETVFDTEFTDTPQAVLQLIKTRGERVKEVAEHARQDVKDAVEDAIGEALREGLPEDQAAQLLTDKLKHSVSNIQSRSRTIARTEVQGAFSEARHTGMNETEPQKKRWISSRDSRVRDSHEHLDGQVVGWGESFKGYHSSIKYPHDPTASGSETINCRCIIEPIYEGEEG
jgi:HK97 family phage portal protein